jgi:hypothetical protein
MDEDQLRRDMVHCLKVELGDGYVDWFYEDRAEPFVQVALFYAQNQEEK